jgi:large subunit ribosomal protein L31
MKTSIHPTYYTDATVTCSCGNSWTTGSTLPELRTDVCDQCHPFFTGEQRIVDSAGQVDRFMKRLQKYDTHQTAEEARIEQNKIKQEQRFVKQQLAALDLDDELIQVLHDATIMSVGDLENTIQTNRDSLTGLKNVTLGVIETMESKLANARKTFFANA